MAVEKRRGCGYRKVGGTYIVSGDFFGDCDRLPFALEVCPCCGEGYRPSRTLRKIDPERMLQGEHIDCNCDAGCIVCNPGIIPMETDKEKEIGHYLEWIGQGFYSTPEEFSQEAINLGISRRLKSGIPRDLVVGQSTIWLAHRHASFQYNRKSRSGRRREIVSVQPGIFLAFKVNRLEHICTDEEFAAVQEHKDVAVYLKDGLEERVKGLIRMVERGVTLVPVPHDDPDHN